MQPPIAWVEGIQHCAGQGWITQEKVQLGQFSQTVELAGVSTLSRDGADEKQDASLMIGQILAQHRQLSTVRICCLHAPPPPCVDRRRACSWATSKLSLNHTWQRLDSSLSPPMARSASISTGRTP